MKTTQNKLLQAFNKAKYVCLYLQEYTNTLPVTKKDHRLIPQEEFSIKPNKILRDPGVPFFFYNKDLYRKINDTSDIMVMGYIRDVGLVTPEHFYHYIKDNYEDEVFPDLMIPNVVLDHDNTDKCIFCDKEYKNKRFPDRVGLPKLYGSHIWKLSYKETKNRCQKCKKEGCVDCLSLVEIDVSYSLIMGIYRCQDCLKL